MNAWNKNVLILHHISETSFAPVQLRTEKSHKLFHILSNKSTKWI
jgi:hypothetical protein